MITYKWQGISADLSITSLIEGIRQLREKNTSWIIYILVHPEHQWVETIYNTLKDENSKYARELCGSPIMFTKVINKQGFILVCESCIFIGSEPID